MNEQTRQTGPVADDFETLKETAQFMIDFKDPIVGLNPHKVKRLCEEFERLRAAGVKSVNELRMEIQAQSVLSETPVIDGVQATAPVPGPDELGEPTRQRVIKSLGRLIADAKHRFDDCRDNLENGSEGGYSPELTEAVELLDELKKGMGPEVRHHDEDTLAAAYNKGFGDAKIIILREVQKLGK